MRRLFLTMICVLGIVPTANALELTSLTPTEIPLFSLLPGDLLTIEFNLTNVNEQSINGLGFSAYGYEGNFSFVEGSAVGNYFNSICVGLGTCFGGLANLAGGALAESAIGANGNRVQVGLSASLVMVSNPGLGVDQGLDNLVGSAMFSLTFEVLSGFGEIRVGTGYPGDGFTIPGDTIQNFEDDLVYTFTPEPGTALLVGFGLAGLSASGSRRGKRSLSA